MLPRAPPTTTRRPPGASADRTGGHRLVRADEVQDHVGAGARPSPPRPRHRRGGRRGRTAEVAGLRSRVDGHHLCGRWSRGGSARPGDPGPRHPITTRRALPRQRVPLGCGSRGTAVQPGVGQRRQHRRRDAVGRHEVPLVGQQHVVRQPAVVAQAAARPGRRGRRSGCPGRAGSCGTRRADHDPVRRAGAATDQRAVGIRRRPPTARRGDARPPASAAARRGRVPSAHVVHEEVAVAEADRADLDQHLPPARRSAPATSARAPPARPQPASPVRRHHGQPGTFGPRPPTSSR